MAEKIQQNQFDEQGVNPFNAPIPGESLTASPDTPTAWERPPEYTDQEEAMRAVYFELTEQDTLRELVNIIDSFDLIDSFKISICIAHDRCECLPKSSARSLSYTIRHT